MSLPFDLLLINKSIKYYWKGKEKRTETHSYNEMMVALSHFLNTHGLKKNPHHK